MQQIAEQLLSVQVSQDATPARADRLAEVRRLIGEDTLLAAAVRNMTNRMLRASLGLVDGARTEVAYLREAIREYEASYCPYCLQDAQDGEEHDELCLIGAAINAANLLGGVDGDFAAR